MTYLEELDKQVNPEEYTKWIPLEDIDKEVESMDETLEVPSEETEATLETKQGTVFVKSGSTTILMTLSMFGFFALYGLGMYLGHIKFNITDLVGGIVALGGVFGLKKWQRQNGASS